MRDRASDKRRTGDPTVHDKERKEGKTMPSATNYGAEEFSQKQVPYSLEAEQAVLGTVLRDPSKLTEVLGKLPSDAFYIPRHRQIYEAMEDLNNRAVPFDGLVLLQTLRDGGGFESDDDKEYLLSLIETASEITKVEYFVNVLKTKFLLRRTLDICAEISGMCYDNESPERILDTAGRKFNDLEKEDMTSQMSDLQSLVKDEMDRLQEMKKDTTGKFEAVKVGIGALDNYIGGLNNSDLVILAARPGIGKTTFALNVAYNMATSSRYSPKKTVAFFSLEMSKLQLARRVISNATLIDHEKLRTGEIDMSDWEVLFNFYRETLRGSRFIVDESSTITVAEMKAKLRREKNLGCVIIDYLQLMGSGTTDNRVQEITAYTRAIKLMAKELNVPVILLSQLSRSITKREDKTPQLSDLRDSGSIEQDADVVMFLDRPETHTPNTPKKNIMEVYIQKNRHGRTGKIELLWDGAHTSIKSIDRTPLPEGI